MPLSEGGITQLARFPSLSRADTLFLAFLFIYLSLYVISLFAVIADHVL